MSKTKRLIAAKGVAAQLHRTEAAIDTALCEAAHLIETYVSSRRKLRISTSVGNDVQSNTLKAMDALNNAQQYMMMAHDGLSVIQTRLGLGQVAIVPAEDKPDTNQPPQPSGVTPELMAAE